MCRLCGEKKVKIVDVGMRTSCQEEIEYADSFGIQFFTSDEIMKDSIREVCERVTGPLQGHNAIPLSIGMDILH